MATQASASVTRRAETSGWRTSTTLAFRFVFIYLTLFALATQLAGGVFILPNASLPAFGTIWPMRAITEWTAAHVFGIGGPLLFAGNSGDTVFHWVQTGWLLVVAVIVTAVWSLLDQRREYTTLHKWFRLFLRFALAAQMFYYGMAKIIPTQFPPPPLVTLVEPVGNQSLSNLLWTFIGSSTPYQMFTGSAELIAGLLLLTPGTTPLGALIALADMIQVWILNMTYDVGLKQISFHLILVALMILAPDLPRLMNVLVFDRAAPPSSLPPLFASGRTQRIALAAQVVFGVYLVAIFTSVSLHYYSAAGGPGAPKSPLYGIWSVDELAVDGQVRPVVLNDYDRRWRRVIFDADDAVIVQRTDDSLAHYHVAIDATSRTISLKKGTSQLWRSSFTFTSDGDRLTLDGEMDGHRIRARLERVELDTFRLLNSTFRWVRPPDPFAG
jgi:uncharacterized membrane protein YphA (DoxX/SURF4 family)